MHGSRRTAESNDTLEFAPSCQPRQCFGIVVSRMPVYEPTELGGPAGPGRTTRLTGFDVVYDFAGERYWIRLPRNPGNRIALDVTVAPAKACRANEDQT